MSQTLEITLTFDELEQIIASKPEGCIVGWQGSETCCPVQRATITKYPHTRGIRATWEISEAYLYMLSGRYVGGRHEEPTRYSLEPRILRFMRRIDALFVDDAPIYREDALKIIHKIREEKKEN